MTEVMSVLSVRPDSAQVRCAKAAAILVDAEHVSATEAPKMRIFRAKDSRT